jgi:hypothetical protein
VYLNAIDETLRRILINNSSLNTVVATRVYPAYLASIPSPLFPCICFSRQSSRRDYRYSKRVTVDYDVYVYSTTGFSQTDTIYEYMKNTLDNEWFDMISVTGRAGFRMIEYGTQDHDIEEKLYFSTFRIQAIAFFN